MRNRVSSPAAFDVLYMYLYSLANRHLFPKFGLRQPSLGAWVACFPPAHFCPVLTFWAFTPFAPAPLPTFISAIGNLIRRAPHFFSVCVAENPRF